MVVANVLSKHLLVLSTVSSVIGFYLSFVGPSALNKPKHCCDLCCTSTNESANCNN